MKKILLSLAVCAGTSATYAQLALSPEIGLNLAKQVGKYRDGNTFKRIERLKSVAGFRAGTGLYIGIAKGFFIQPGVFYARKGVSQSIRYGSSLIMDTKLTYHTLEIPLDLGYEHSFGKAGSVFITGGPCLGYALSGKQHDQVSLGGTLRDERTIDVLYDDDTQPSSQKSVELALNFSAGYKLPVGLYLRFRYGMGLSNAAMASDDRILRSRVWSGMLGYAITLKQKRATEKI